MRLFGLLGSLVAFCSLCQAQDVGEQRVIARAVNLDVREAIRRLFKSVGVPCTIDPAVKGRITIRLQGASFEQALQTILIQVRATYRVEGGVFQIILRDDLQGDVGTFDPPHIEVSKSDCRLAFAKIFGDFKFRTVIQPQVQGLITYTATPTSFDQLIRLLTEQVGATYQRSVNGIEVSKPPPTPPVFVMIEDLPYSKSQSVKDTEHEYEVKRNYLNKIELATRKVVSSVRLERSMDSMNLDLNKPSERKTMIQVAKSIDFNLSIAPEVKDKVQIEDGPATIENLMMSLTTSLKVPLTKFDGKYLMLSPVNSHVFLNLFDFDPIGENTYSPSSIKIAGPLLQVDTGRWRYLVRKDDFSIVKWEPRPN